MNRSSMILALAAFAFAAYAADPGRVQLGGAAAPGEMRPPPETATPT